MKKKYRFWLAASILVAILYGLSGFRLAFATAFTVQDDARQWVFWLQKLNDSQLFSDDLIAEYFSSVAPIGYKFLYWLANIFGVEPFLFNKFIPILLAIGNSIYLFLLTVEIYPLPMAGFFSSLLLNQNLWMLDDLSSGTPRAFFYLLFLGFVYYLGRQQLLPCLLFVGLQGLFYPQVVLISAGILCLNLITKTKNRSFYLTGLIIAIAILAVYKLQSGEFNQVISLATAKQLPEFYPGGRSSFFLDNPFSFWLTGKRSGFFPYEWQYSLLCVLILLLVKFLSKSAVSFRSQPPSPELEIIWQTLLASTGLFFLAHLLLFKLHLPSRYTQHTWRIAIALIVGIGVATYLQSILIKIPYSRKSLKLAVVAIAITLLLYPTYAVQSRPYRLGYENGDFPQLYQFLQQQPKDIMVASISDEGDFIPSLAQRSILVSREYSIPYHWDFYQPLRQKTQALVKAQYSQDRTEVKRFIEQYSIDFWLLDKDAFTPEYLLDNSWLKPFKLPIERAKSALKLGNKPVLAIKSDRCSVLETDKFYLLDAKCLISTDE